MPPCELALRQVPRSEDLIVDIVGTGGDGQVGPQKPTPFCCIISVQFIATFPAGWSPQKVVIVKESPQNGRNIQIKDL